MLRGQKNSTSTPLVEEEWGVPKLETNRAFLQQLQVVPDPGEGCPWGQVIFKLPTLFNLIPPAPECDN